MSYVSPAYRTIDDKVPINAPFNHPLLRADRGIGFIPAFQQTPNGPVLRTMTNQFPKLVRESLYEYEHSIIGKPKI